MRAFVGVEIPSLESSPRDPARAPEHLTLRFLGEVGSDRVGPISERLALAVSTLAPFDLRLEGVGAFPSPDAPRVVWVGVTQGRSELMDLANRVREALRGEGSAPAEGPFVPHATLFRVRSPAAHRAARELLNGHRPPPAPRTTRVRAVLLKESVLGPGGAVHRTLGTFPLGNAPA